jgi:hypothetical protein
VSSWSPWESLGGVFTTGPAAASRGPGRLDVFGRGGDFALWHARFANGRWSDWVSLGGGLTSRPAAASRERGSMTVFARGTDNALWYRAHHMYWSSWKSLGGELVSGPAACSWPSVGRLDVFAFRRGSELMQRTYRNGWRNWEFPGRFYAELPIWDPAAASWGPERIDVCVRDNTKQLLRKWYDHGWEKGGTRLVGGLVATSSQALASWGPGRLDLFARGEDDALWHKVLSDDESTWESLGGIVTAAPAAASWGHGRIDVFVKGTDDAVWTRHFPGGG